MTICTHIHTHVTIRMCLYADTYTCRHIRIRLYADTYTYTCGHTHTHVAMIYNSVLDLNFIHAKYTYVMYVIMIYNPVLGLGFTSLSDMGLKKT